MFGDGVRYFLHVSMHMRNWGESDLAEVMCDMHIHKLKSYMYGVCMHVRQHICMYMKTRTNTHTIQHTKKHACMQTNIHTYILTG